MVRKYTISGCVGINPLSPIGKKLYKIVIDMRLSLIGIERVNEYRIVIVQIYIWQLLLVPAPNTELEVMLRL